MASRYREICRMFYNPADKENGKEDGNFSGEYPFGGKLHLFKRRDKDGNLFPENQPQWVLKWSDGQGGGGMMSADVDNPDDVFGQ